MGKNALVIGGSGGIGSEIVRSLAKDGVKVWATYYQDKSGAENSGRGGADFLQMDVLKEGSINQAMEEVKAKSGKIDVFVYAVTSPIVHSSFLKSDWSVYQGQIDTQIKGFFLVLKHLAEQVKSGHKTKIIVILTEYCFGKPASGVSDYVTAKHGLMGFSKSLAVEFARYGSTVNMVSPGMTQTDLIAGLPAKAVELAELGNPLKRIAVPQDVAGVVSFLASDASDYLNGVNILVNGGGVMA